MGTTRVSASKTVAKVKVRKERHYRPHVEFYHAVSIHLAHVQDLVGSAAEPTGPWVPRNSVTRAEADVLGLPTGSRCYFRVRAVGAAGPGPWSDIAMKIVGA